MAELTPIEITALEIDAAWQVFSDGRPDLLKLAERAPDLFELVQSAYKNGFTDGAVGILREQHHGRK